ncbi:MAG TPA: bifunctional phosphoribosylaminoimidazolecarboxamide formyltransferase/IMP cyclohydrolase, partial [Euryarchaeota archaeon]|nr:bifunctional phosphoribosylaminoimidazolecarboxamide formyltransferase/IMP cyclohydrolase [Euryarchaeota archaeon]
ESELLEMIDIGGPTLLRASAKSYERVVVACDPDDYLDIISRLQKDNIDAKRKELALKAFAHTAHYDSVIYSRLWSRWKPNTFPDYWGLAFEKISDLRYGENPHQRGALYGRFDPAPSSLANAEKLWGKELSYNNLLDSNNALSIVRDFQKPCVTIVKHINPCGVAIGETIEEAWHTAYSSDPMSAFGGIVAFNRELSAEIAQGMRKIFLEVIIAPSVAPEALDILKKKKDRRIIVTGPLEPHVKGWDFKNIEGGLLLQDKDNARVTREQLKVVTERTPTKSEYEAMLFGANLLKRVRSNTILFTNSIQTVGIGAGQMSRVDAVKIAGEKSRGRSSGCAMASDAFFPFRDGIDVAHEFGITAVIQAGGSVRDQEVIDAANEHNMTMVFSGTRAFWH